MTWSSHCHTPTGSVALSPPADSDAMYEGTQGPATPEFSAPSPPYDSKMPFQKWDGQHLQHAQFALAYEYVPRYDCINPSDISPEQHIATPPADPNDGPMDLSYLSGRYSVVDGAAIDPELLPEPFQQEGSVSEPDTVSEIVGSRGADQVAPAEPEQQTSSGKSWRRTRRVNRSVNTSRLPDPPARGRGTSQIKTERLLPRVQDHGPCDFCGESFKDQITLQRHVRSSHRRPFTCVFHYAGCNMTFAAKNEWKRHVLSQHLGLYFWHCTLDHCSQVNPLHAHGRSSTPGVPPFGSIFNRKDLYTQHVRRMHFGADGSNKKMSQDAEEKLKVFQEAAKKKRCELPVYMECPAVGCSKQFRGSNAWDERMEHVACHLGQAASGKEEDVFFGGDHDPTLTNWAASPDVLVVVPLSGGGWQHRNPLKGTGGPAGGGGGVSSAWSVTSPMGDQDAEGEDCGPEN